MTFPSPRLRLAFSKAVGLGNVGKVLSLIFQLLPKIDLKIWNLEIEFGKTGLAMCVTCDLYICSFF